MKVKTKKVGTNVSDANKRKHLHGNFGNRRIGCQKFFKAVAMSCILRSVRQAAASSSRLVASRNIQQRAVALAVGPLRQISRLSPLNSRSFSVSARVFGEGSSASCPTYIPAEYVLTSRSEFSQQQPTVRSRPSLGRSCSTKRKLRPKETLIS